MSQSQVLRLRNFIFKFMDARVPGSSHFGETHLTTNSNVQRDVFVNILKAKNQRDKPPSKRRSAQISRCYSRNIPACIVLIRAYYFSKNAIGSRGNGIQRGPRTYEHRARRKSNLSVPRAFACVATKHARTREMKHVNTRGKVKYRKRTGRQPARRKILPGTVFFNGPAEGPFLSSSFSIHPAQTLSNRPFRPQIESMPSRELREAATRRQFDFNLIPSPPLSLLLRCTFFRLHFSFLRPTTPLSR